MSARAGYLHQSLRSLVDCANAAVFKRSIERILSDEGRSRRH
jgi:hypothetical protein